jgi:hypothetical protein
MLQNRLNSSQFGQIKPYIFFIDRFGLATKNHQNIIPIYKMLIGNKTGIGGKSCESSERHSCTGLIL